MRFINAFVVVVSAGISALAQTTESTPSLSPTCFAAILEALTPISPLYECLRLDIIFQKSNGSIVPDVDTYLTDICEADPCTSSIVANFSSAIVEGCASDVAAAGLTPNLITDIIGQYPQIREVACLKTTHPFNGTNATIPITDPPYNRTNGTFCITSLLTELSAYIGANITVPLIQSLISASGNRTRLQLIEMIPPTKLCSDCILAAVDVIEEEYPMSGNIIFAADTTPNEYLEKICNATGFPITNNGTLPDTIAEVAVNSTFPFNVTASNVTSIPSNDSVPPPDIMSNFNYTVISSGGTVIRTATSSSPVASATYLAER